MAAGPRLEKNVTTAAPGAVRSASQWGVLLVLCISLLVITLDTTILNVALPSIVRAMNASTSDLQWIVDAYVVVFAGLLLVLGSVGDRFGRKWVFLFGIAIFAIGSACSAFSTTPDRLIGSRALMGVGAAAIMPSTLSILANVFTGETERARAIGIWTATSGLGVAVGPVAGGWLLSHYWWGSVFLVNLPIAIVGLSAGLAIVPNSRDPASPPPDAIGGALSVVGMGALLWGIIEAPTDGWGSARVISALVGAVGILTVFVLFERRSDHPMLRLTLFRSARFSIAIVTLGLAMFALMGGLFLLTQYLQFSLGYSALGAGERIAPIAAVLLVAAPCSVPLARRFGAKIVVFAGMALVAVGLALTSRVTVSGSYLDVLPDFFMIGAGVGLALAPCLECVIGSLPLGEAGVGSATNSAAQQTGAALGVAVLGSLLSTRYASRLAPVLAHYPIPHSILALIRGSLGGALAVAAQVGGRSGEELAALARQSFVNGLDLAVLIGAVVVGIAALVALFVLPSRAATAPPQPPFGRHAKQRLAFEEGKEWTMNRTISDRPDRPARRRGTGNVQATSVCARCGSGDHVEDQLCARCRRREERRVEEGARLVRLHQARRGSSGNRRASRRGA
jgi:EmrB/QacA subfamily drug resistance transporter